VLVPVPPKLDPIVLRFPGDGEREAREDARDLAEDSGGVAQYMSSTGRITGG
jgi:hypothetical protein